MQFQNTEILSTKFQPNGYIAGNIKPNPNNTNKKYGFAFGRSQEPLIHSWKNSGNFPMEVHNLSITALLRAMFVHSLSFPVTLLNPYPANVENMVSCYQC